jgi:hypothetical protein
MGGPFHKHDCRLIQDSPLIVSSDQPPVSYHSPEAAIERALTDALMRSHIHSSVYRLDDSGLIDFSDLLGLK